MNVTRLSAIAALTATVAFVGGTAFWVTRSQGDGFESCRTSQVAGGAAQIGGPFELVSETGETVTDAEVIDKPTLIYFGYTFCPDVCPLDGMRNGMAVELLEEQGYAVNSAFISVDPERDTPEVVGDFTDAFHPDMVGLTGTIDQVDGAVKAYRAYYNKQDGDPDYYLVDHTTFTYLMTPEHGFVEFFRRETTESEMADKVACFLDKM